MALKITAINNTNAPFGTQAYAHISNFFGTKDQIQVLVEVHITEQARRLCWPSAAENLHYINMEDLSGDLMPAMYGVLKTLPLYQGAEDV